MDDALRGGMDAAQDNVVGDPKHEQPASPVARAKEAGGSYDGEEADKAHQQDVVLKGSRLLELSGVVTKPDQTGSQKEEANHGY
jgi:hypothetical protein